MYDIKHQLVVQRRVLHAIIYPNEKAISSSPRFQEKLRYIMRRLGECVCIELDDWLQSGDSGT